MPGTMMKRPMYKKGSKPKKKKMNMKTVKKDTPRTKAMGLA